MPTSVTLYRLFVASPGDCKEERQIIRDIVSDWNVAYGQSREIHLEPVLWETHARPELGDRPQAIINRQLLNTCDALIAVFRTRLGTPTAVAESGTAEEIHLFQQARKPVLLYFHRSLPSEELDRFRLAISQRGLVWSYDGLWEFTRDVAKHIALAMAELAGTPDAQATFANELTASSPRALATADIPSLLLALRAHTHYLWDKLESLPLQVSEFTCAVKQTTFERVRDALDGLASGGQLKFKTELTQSTAADDEPVLTITVSAISDAVRQATSNIVRERGVKNFFSLGG
jgi:hypothetical protein